VEHFLESWGYVAIFVLCFISSMGLPVGSEVAIVYGGVLTSGKVPHQAHDLHLPVVIAVAVLGELCGSLAGYLVGYFGGRQAVDRFGKFVLLTHRDLDRADAWFARRGERTVLFGRFVPLFRSFISFAAGLGEMAVPKFLLFTAIGCTIWCTLLATLGSALGSSYSHALKAFSLAGYAAVGVCAVAVAILFWHRLRVVRSERID
jgi:membrane protein DedA with SNARE-associated domain